jgi:hypothetical protein
VVSGSQSLPEGVNSTYFYVRWTGWLTPLVSGVYTLGLNVGDGGDFYINAQPIVNTLASSQMANDTTDYTQSDTIELSANIPYQITIEWQHGPEQSPSPVENSYQCQLLWTQPGGTVQVIPAAFLSLTGKWWNMTEEVPYPNIWY